MKSWDDEDDDRRASSTILHGSGGADKAEKFIPPLGVAGKDPGSLDLGSLRSR
jgi:hypothetical protein